MLTWPGLVPCANETRVTGSIPQRATHRSTPESRSTRTGEQTSVGSRCSLKTYFLRGAKDIWRHFHRYKMKEWSKNLRGVSNSQHNCPELFLRGPRTGFLSQSSPKWIKWETTQCIRARLTRALALRGPATEKKGQSLVISEEYLPSPPGRHRSSELSLRCWRTFRTSVTTPTHSNCDWIRSQCGGCGSWGGFPRYSFNPPSWNPDIFLETESQTQERRQMY